MMKPNHKIAIGAIALFLGVFALAARYEQSARVPVDSIQSSVIRNQALLDRAWQLPTAAAFAHTIIFQSNASVCGAASLANVFRSLGDTPDTEGAVLAATARCWFGICPFGLTLDELAELGQRSRSRKIAVLRDLTPEAFQKVLRDSNNPAHRYIINFSRKPIFGAGVGHHSPLGGYLEAEDLVFVLDVNSNYGPWLVERARLFSAMDTIDGEKKRGLLSIE